MHIFRNHQPPRHAQEQRFITATQFYETMRTSAKAAMVRKRQACFTINRPSRLPGPTTPMEACVAARRGARQIMTGTEDEAGSAQGATDRGSTVFLQVIAAHAGRGTRLRDRRGTQSRTQSSNNQPPFYPPQLVAVAGAIIPIPRQQRRP